MISSNTRSTRSRYSSPAQPQGGSWNGSGPLEPSKSANKEASSRAFMQNWLEPSVQSKTSFEEAGLVRYGVLENMAPLGSLPKSKKTTNENGQPVRKIILRPSGAHGATSPPEPDASEVPAAAPLPASPPPPQPPHQPASAPPPRRSQANKAAAAAAADDDDYDPNETSRRRQSARASLPKKPRRSSGVGKASMPPAKPVATGSRRASTSGPQDREMVDKVVEEAVDEALKHYRYPTAWALRTLYDEKGGEPGFAAMIEQVFTQAADAETFAEFSRQIEEKKREGKKDNQGCYYFVPPATNSRFTPHKPKAAPYGKLLHPRQDGGHRQSESQGGEARAAKKIKVSHGGDPATPRKMRANNGVSASKSASKTPRSRKRARRDSGSSESSLSSAMSLSPPEAGSADADSPSLSPSLRGGAGAGAGAKAQSQAQSQSQAAAPKTRPITTRGKSLASKLAESNASGSSLLPTSQPGHHTHTQAQSLAHSRSLSNLHPRSRSHARATSTSAGDTSMPGRVAAADLFPNLPGKPTGKTSKDDGKSRTPGDDETFDDDDDGFWARRREARKVTNGYSATESAIRPNLEERDATPVRTTRRTRQSLLAPVSTRATRSASKRPNDDADSVVSPVGLSFPGFSGEGGSTMGSRAGTPSSLRLSKKPRSGLRVKSSPMKKKGGTAAGVPRSMGEAQSSVNGNGGGAPKDQAASDNDECCSACGNTGDVVCCDGCPRSFHFECVDMVPSEHLPDEWYCNECLIRRYPSRVPLHKGSFASALNTLEKSIPRAFSLPKRLQNRFEGVKAGADGDYEEVASGKLGKRKTGYEDLPDFFRQREDGQAVLCHECQKPATEIKAIIPCSVCPFHWHIDCLDPPLAVPPVLKTWKCPLHVDDILSEAPPLAPAHRYRKVKNTQAITPAVTRGVKNNGHIEIDWTDEPDADANEAGWPEPESFGRTYKLPARGIVLDFIEQLRRQGAGYGPRRNEARRVPYLSPPVEDRGGPLHGSSLDRSVEEMQVSLNLVGLKQRPTESVDQLRSALLAAADPNVVSLMAQANAANIASGNLTDGDKLGLRSMLAQMDTMSARIRQALGEGGRPPASPATAVQGTTPVSQVAAEEEAPPKVEAVAPVTEPTPPSTVDQAEGTMDLD